MGREASRTRIEARTVELGGRFVEVQAPAHWTNARLDAWIDWAGGGATDIPAAIADIVEDLTARAQAKGLVKDVRARTRFRDELTEALLAGVIAIGARRRPAPPPPVVEAGSPEIARAVAAHRGQRGGRSRGPGARPADAGGDGRRRALRRRRARPAPIPRPIRASPAPPRPPARPAPPTP